jgi:hypothetical protein
MNYCWIIEESTKSSKLLNNHKEFCNEIFILDHLSGKEPLLFDKNIIAGKKNNLKFCACTLLDSNVMSSIHRFIEGNYQNDGLIEFLEFITKNKWGLTPYFYYMEAYSKGIIDKKDRTQVREYLIKHTKSLLKLYLMDEIFFLKNKKYKETVNEEQIFFYLKGKTIDEVASERVDNFIINYSNNINLLGIEILLIKMIFINLFELPKGTVKEKLDIFDNFMQSQLGKIFAREYYLAKQYFNGSAGKIFGIHNNSKQEKVLNTIKSTTWDLFLLRLPEYSFIHPDGNYEFDIGFIVTQEKSLFKLGKLFKYDKIFIKNNIPIPIFLDSEELNIEKTNDNSNENISYLHESMLKCLKNYFPN